MSGPATRSFYRIAKSWPPSDREYRTNQEKKGDPDPTWSEERRYAWDGLSMYDSEEGARDQARKTPMFGRFIVRYDIPDGIGIAIRKTFGPGHFTIKGDKDTLKRCLVPDEVSTV